MSADMYTHKRSTRVNLFVYFYKLMCMYIYIYVYAHVRGESLSGSVSE